MFELSVVMQDICERDWHRGKSDRRAGFQKIGEFKTKIKGI